MCLEKESGSDHLGGCTGPFSIGRANGGSCFATFLLILDRVCQLRENACARGKRPTVTVEPLYNPRSKRHEIRLILAFYKKVLRLPLNKIQAVVAKAGR